MNRFQILKLPDSFTPCYDPLPPLPIPPKKDLNKQRIISELLQTPERQQHLAESMAQPLRNPLDYPVISEGAVTRRTFSVQPFPVFISSTITV